MGARPGLLALPACVDVEVARVGGAEIIGSEVAAVSGWWRRSDRILYETAAAEAA